MSSVFAKTGEFTNSGGKRIPHAANFKQVFIILHRLPRRSVIYIADGFYTTMAPEQSFPAIREVERDLAESLVSTLKAEGAILLTEIPNP